MFSACWQVTVAGLTCPFRRLRALCRECSCTSQEGETEQSEGEHWQSREEWRCLCEDDTEEELGRLRAPAVRGGGHLGRSCLEPHAYTCQLWVNSKRSRAAGAPRPAERGTGDPSQSARLPLPHERAIQSRRFLWQRGDSKPCECPSCPCLAQRGYSQGPACSPTCGVFCGLQGQPCQVMPRGTNPSCRLTWKVLTLFSRVKLGVRGGDSHAQGLSPSRDPLSRQGNSKPDVSTERQLPGSWW